jgi:hypothetical protein
MGVTVDSTVTPVDFTVVTHSSSCPEAASRQSRSKLSGSTTP